MKTLLASLLCFAALLTTQAADEPRLIALRAADDARVAAMKAPDRTPLTTLLSDELRYAHSTGAVDDKAGFIDTLLTGRTKYVGFDYEERNFTFPAPGIALMTGRTRIQATTAAGSVDSVLSFLGVWREEHGQWRFLAWQSCKLPPATPAAK